MHLALLRSVCCFIESIILKKTKHSTISWMHCATVVIIANQANHYGACALCDIISIYWRHIRVMLSMVGWYCFCVCRNVQTPESREIQKTIPFLYNNSRNNTYNYILYIVKSCFVRDKSYKPLRLKRIYIKIWTEIQPFYFTSYSECVPEKSQLKYTN